MKKIVSLILTLATALGTFAFSLPAGAEDGLADSGLDYTESTEMIKNPLMGYPSHASITFDDNMSVRNDSGFMWYYININRYSGGNDLYETSGGTGRRPVGGKDRPISDEALERFSQTLYNSRMNGSTCIMRFVYDWNDVRGCEPADFEMILTHIKQLCAVVSKYPDVVYGFECGIIGVFGEMHSSNYCAAEYANRIIDTYIENTPDSMTLMVRTPTYIMNYLGLDREELAQYTPKKGSVPYRLSYFNDGYMNSTSDLGTWVNRPVDLNFLEKTSEHNSYGGEYGSAYSTQYIPNSACVPENAIPEMYRTHVNFIRGNVYKINDRNKAFGYDQYTYSEEYEKDYFPDNSAFYGKDCYTFITAHLGYRLVLRKSLLSSETKAGGELRLSGIIENTGFANVLTRPTAQVLLVHGGYIYKCDADIDAYDIKSCEKYDYDMTFSLPSNMPAGKYSVYLRFSSSTNSALTERASGLRFANNGNIFNDSLGANLLGEISVGEADIIQSAESDAFLQTNSALPGARVTRGVPYLAGYGMSSVGGTVSVTYSTGDDMTLSALNMLRSDASATYTWYKNGKSVSSDESLHIENITKDDSGEYYLKVTSSGRSNTTPKINVSVSEHSFGSVTVTKAPACHSSGKGTRVCADCGQSEVVMLPALSHIAGEQETDPSTCTVEGNEHIACTLCGDYLEYKLLPLAEHPYEENITPATCTEDGVINRVCTACGHTESEVIPCPGHDYKYKVNENKLSGVCAVCGEPFAETEYDGTMGTAGITASDFDNKEKGAQSVTGDEIVLIGDGGYVSSYEFENPSSNLTFLFRATGVEKPMYLGKFRLLSYPWGQKNNVRDSNNAPNYYGDALYKITEDGLWAFTLSKIVMNNAGNSFGGVVKAAFNDPESTKGNKNTSNPNENAKIELVGIYEGKLSHATVFTDENGAVLEKCEETYHGGSVWTNYMTKIKTPAEALKGGLPKKENTPEYVYTFSHFEDADGNRVDELLTKSIIHPVYTEQKNTCAHLGTKTTVTTEPTCTEEGKCIVYCEDCGAVLSSDTVLEKLPHSGGEATCTRKAICSVCVTEYGELDPENHTNESERIKPEPTFRASGKREIYCADCGEVIRTEEIPPIENKFADVSLTAWYSDAVSFAVYRGTFGGITETQFSPNTNMTRAMFVTVLGRMHGAEDNQNKKTVFTDVPTGRYYSGYVAWACENGIVNGKSAISFAPHDNITREEICVMIKRYCDYAGLSANTPAQTAAFLDMPSVSSWARDAVLECQRGSVITGKRVTQAGVYFEPLANATRAEVATILKNLCDNYN